VICRYAGDEFVAVLPETNETEVKRIAEMIQKSTRKLKLKCPVTVSMGVTKCSDGMSRHDFILKANAALHKAKSDGKNCIHCQSKMG
jgi:diguanylate cyclase (GGDEF)-like protein